MYVFILIKVLKSILHSQNVNRSAYLEGETLLESISSLRYSIETLFLVDISFGCVIFCIEIYFYVTSGSLTTPSGA